MTLAVTNNPNGFQSPTSALGVLQGAAGSLQGSAVPLQSTVAPGRSGTINVPERSAPAPKAAGTSSSSGNGTATSSTAPTDLSAYDQGINSYKSGINNLTPTLNNDLATIANSYTSTLNSLNQQNAQTKQAYNTAKTQDAQGYVTSKNTINTNTGNTINSVDRLLGARGASGQSAGDYAALLAGKQGTQQRADVGKTFATNEQGLDTNYNNTENAYNLDVQNAGLQRDQNTNLAHAQYNTNKANLLQSLATLLNQRTAAAGGSGTGASQPYINQAQSLMAEAAKLGHPAPIAAQTPLTYTPPSLASYTTNPAAAVAVGKPGASAATDSATPYLAALINRKNANAQAG